jgi:hypothetical protein
MIHRTVMGKIPYITVKHTIIYTSCSAQKDIAHICLVCLYRDIWRVSVENNTQSCTVKNNTQSYPVVSTMHIDSPSALVNGQLLDCTIMYAVRRCSLQPLVLVTKLAVCAEFRLHLYCEDKYFV